MSSVRNGNEWSRTGLNEKNIRGSTQKRIGSKRVSLLARLLPVTFLLVTTLDQRVTLIELENKEDKIIIMKNKSKLGKLTGNTIYIDNGYTLKEQQTQKNISKRAVEERQKGSQGRVGYQKMAVDGREWKWNGKKSEFETSQKIVRSSKN